MTALPAGAQTRAIVVALERYPGLSSIPGTVSGAFAFAEWLTQSAGLEPSSIQLWLAPENEDVDKQIPPSLRECVRKPFEETRFFQQMAEPSDRLKDGSFLIFYWSGHGVVAGNEGRQSLVLPEATARQMLCFSLNNMRQLFKGNRYSHFQHQLWIIDACRSPIGDWLTTEAPRAWNVDPAGSAKQFIMFSCLNGEAAKIDSRTGPEFTRALLDQLQVSGRGAWPDFQSVFKDVAAQFDQSRDTSQHPTFSMFGEDWYERPLIGPGFRGEPLLRLLSKIEWPIAKFRPHFEKVLPALRRGSDFESLEAAVRLLDDLPPIGGIAPTFDFAERVARANGNGPKPLREWLDANLTEHERIELNDRLCKELVRAKLSLWYREDGPFPCMDAELEVIDAEADWLARWGRLRPKPSTPETINTTVGDWLTEVYSRCGDVSDLLLHIYLPRRLLPGRYDIAKVSVLGGTDYIQLGEHLHAFLGCSDRWKAPSLKIAWHKYARVIIGRLSQGRPVSCSRLRWTVLGEKRDKLKQEFWADDAKSPTWLGIRQMSTVQDDSGKAAFDDALAAGLPAILWLCSEPNGCQQVELENKLEKLLAHPICELPMEMIKWRSVQTIESAPYVGLLLDDLDRLPKLWNKFNQPGESQP